MFKIMTWNVENLFKPGAGSGPPSQAAYDAKVNGLAATIKDQAPDILALQEIGDPTALDDLIKKIGGTWHRHVSTRPDLRGIRVAWLTPHAIADPQDVIDFPPSLSPVQVDDTGATLAKMGRGAVAVTVDPGTGEAVQLLTVHLKSKLLTFPGGRFSPHDEDERARFAAYALYRRSAEAATVRVWATAALADQGGQRAVIVTGDLNDTVQAATTQLLLGPPGSEIGTPGFGQPDAGDKQRLWDLAPLMPAGADYSRINQGRKELIDHILVSKALVDRVKSTQAVITQPIPSISENPNARLAAPSSDHAPVVATFDA